MFLILVPIDHMPAEMNLIFDLSTDTVEPLYNKVLGVANDFLLPQHSKIYWKNLNVTKPRQLQGTDFTSSFFPSLFRGSTLITENIRRV